MGSMPGESQDIFQPAYWRRKCEEISDTIPSDNGVKVMMSYDWVKEYDIKTKNNHFYSDNFKNLYRRLIIEGMGLEFDADNDTITPSLDMLQRRLIKYTSSHHPRFFNGIAAFILLVQLKDATVEVKGGGTQELSAGCPLSFILFHALEPSGDHIKFSVYNEEYLREYDDYLAVAEDRLSGRGGDGEEVQIEGRNIHRYKLKGAHTVELTEDQLEKSKQSLDINEAHYNRRIRLFDKVKGGVMYLAHFSSDSRFYNRGQILLKCFLNLRRDETLDPKYPTTIPIFLELDSKLSRFDDLQRYYRQFNFAKINELDMGPGTNDLSKQISDLFSVSYELSTMLYKTEKAAYCNNLLDSDPMLDKWMVFFVGREVIREGDASDAEELPDDLLHYGRPASKIQLRERKPRRATEKIDDEKIGWVIGKHVRGEFGEEFYGGRVISVKNVGNRKKYEIKYTDGDIATVELKDVKHNMKLLGELSDTEKEEFISNIDEVVSDESFLNGEYDSGVNSGYDYVEKLIVIRGGLFAKVISYHPSKKDTWGVWSVKDEKSNTYRGLNYTDIINGIDLIHRYSVDELKERMEVIKQFNSRGRREDEGGEEYGEDAGVEEGEGGGEGAEVEEDEGGGEDEGGEGGKGKDFTTGKYRMSDKQLNQLRQEHKQLFSKFTKHCLISSIVDYVPISKIIDAFTEYSKREPLTFQLYMSNIRGAVVDGLNKIASGDARFPGCHKLSRYNNRGITNIELCNEDLFTEDSRTIDGVLNVVKLESGLARTRKDPRDVNERRIFADHFLQFADDNLTPAEDYQVSFADIDRSFRNYVGQFMDLTKFNHSVERAVTAEMTKLIRENEAFKNVQRKTLKSGTFFINLKMDIIESTQSKKKRGDEVKRSRTTDAAKAMKVERVSRGEEMEVEQAKKSTVVRSSPSGTIHIDTIGLGGGSNYFREPDIFEMSDEFGLSDGKQDEEIDVGSSTHAKQKRGTWDQGEGEEKGDDIVVSRSVQRKRKDGNGDETRRSRGSDKKKKRVSGGGEGGDSDGGGVGDGGGGGDGDGGGGDGVGDNLKEMFNSWLVSFVDECLLYEEGARRLYLNDIVQFLKTYMIIKHDSDMTMPENKYMDNLTRRNLKTFISLNKKLKGVKSFKDTSKKVLFNNLKINRYYMP